MCAPIARRSTPKSLSMEARMRCLKEDLRSDLEHSRNQRVSHCSRELGTDVCNHRLEQAYPACTSWFSEGPHESSGSGNGPSSV